MKLYVDENDIAQANNFVKEENDRIFNQNGLS